MKTSTLQYCKIILLKMQFSRKLFLKEYRKALKMLQPCDASHLKSWIRKGSLDNPALNKNLNKKN
jgi:hypothetical protein